MRRSPPLEFSLILPTYNAGALLDRTWPQILAFIEKHAGRWETLFVCDGCTDGSDLELERRVAELEGRTQRLIRIIRYTRNRGKGYAVRLGLLRAKGTYRIFTDVDLAYRLDQAEAVAEQLKSGQDVVIASRAHRESEVIQNTGMGGYMHRRQMQSLVFSTIARVLLGIRQRDPQAGLKGFSARVTEQILRHVRCYGFGFDCDLLVACKYFGVPVREVPIRVVYESTASTTSLGSSLRMIRELWSIRQRWGRVRRDGLEDNVLAPVETPVNAMARKVA